ncbi:pentapeptide repeat-containing protein [Amycolatopsis sp. NPDC003861]
MAGRKIKAKPKPLFARMLDASMGLVIVAAITVGTLAIFADNAALLAVLDVDVYFHVAGLGIGLGIARLLVVTPVRNSWVRFGAVTLTAATVIVATTAIPTVFRAMIAQHSPPPATPPPGTPLLVESTSLTHALHRDQNLSNSRIVGAAVQEVDFGGADLHESDFRNSTFTNVNFAGANLCAVDIRGANLEGALHLNEVKNWRWVFFDSTTKVPSDISLARIAGTVESTTGELIYSCEPNQTRQITSDGHRR